MAYYIKDNFYFDIDNFNQLRITGPQNHLLLGVTFPDSIQVSIDNFYLEQNQLVIILSLSKKEINIAIPLVTDIRTIRGYTEGVRPLPTYDQLAHLGIKDVLPQNVTRSKHKDRYIYKFFNKYLDEKNRKKIYGAKISISSQDFSKIENNRLIIKSEDKLKLTIKTVNNVRVLKKLKADVFNTPYEFDKDLFDDELLRIYQISGESIEHLVKSLKTSSFEYGTIFPRDWVESADLGVGDLSPRTIDYMYGQAMQFISETGEGWHEDIVGAYKQKEVNKNAEVNRIMIDIEPRYLMGIDNLSKKFLENKEIKRKFRLVANYILRNAEDLDLISFKKIRGTKNDFYQVGNWRDSNNAFLRQKSPISPYDVNCVFYPTSLRMIKKYHDYLMVKDISWLDKIIQKWDKNKLRFRMYHPYDIAGYAIALYGEKNKPIPVSHLDEGYDLFYGEPTMEDAVSFALKLIDPDFFYTPVGPILVANDEDEYTQKQYHGKVIWPKQAAFAIAGLGRQYRRGIDLEWPKNVLETIKTSIIKASEECFRGWKQLGSVPELYYYDHKSNKARFYTDQDEYEGQMSMVQLWSSVGVRRIMREYQYIKSMV